MTDIDMEHAAFDDMGNEVEDVEASIGEKHTETLIWPHQWIGHILREDSLPTATLEGLLQE